MQGVLELGVYWHLGQKFWVLHRQTGVPSEAWAYANTQHRSLRKSPQLPTQDPVDWSYLQVVKGIGLTSAIIETWEWVRRKAVKSRTARYGFITL